MQRYRVGIAGATGLVGQRLVQRLADHPWFDIVALAASERSAGRAYAEAVDWRLGADPPAGVLATRVRRCTADGFEDCDLVLSGLDASVARELEPALAERGLAVVSNSSAHRLDPRVPLLVPAVNSAHLRLVEREREAGRGGFIVTNPNCSVIGLAVALAPLHREFGVRRVFVATMQALSGAGAEGPRALDLLDNVIPFIPGEEDKLEHEMRKILGPGDPGGEEAGPVVSAHCHRVATLDGHLEAASVELEQPVAPQRVVEVMRAFRGDVAGAGLPSAAERALIVRDEVDRPQPRRDRETGGGMTVVVGRVRRCPLFGVKFALLSHNTVLGAAGSTVLNAELLASRGLLPRRGGP